MARKLSKILVSQTEADLIKNKTAQQDAMGFATDEDSLVFNQHVIRGVSDWGRQKLKAMEDAEVLSKLTASITFSPGNGSYITGGASGYNATITVTLKFNGQPAAGATVTKVAAGGTPKLDGDGKAFTADANHPGTYTLAVKPVNDKYTATDGHFGEKVKVHVAYNGMEKDFSVDYDRYAITYFGGGAETITAADVVKLKDMGVKNTVAGTYTIATTPGQYVWLCVPSFLAISSVTAVTGTQTSPVPMDDVKTVTGVKQGEEAVTYKCYRTGLAVNGTSVTFRIA